MSLGGEMHFGLIADRELVPDVDALAGYLVDELELLCAETTRDPVAAP